MSVVVFLGPSLPGYEVVLPDADVRPPAAMGDVYRAALEHPRAIVLIDGYFHHTRAVWHKEVLWALSEGIPVYGAASMGALRAVELAAFGMVGVGTIYEQFACGALEDDDEVTIVHGEAAEGYRAYSEAMVDVRATLQHACELGAIDAASAARLLAIAKGLHYSERSYPAILQLARETPRLRSAAADFAARLAKLRVSQKRLDSLAVLAHVAQQQPARFVPRFTFNATSAWLAMSNEARRVVKDDDAGGSPALLADLVLELRLGARLGRVWHAALARARALRGATPAPSGLALDTLRDTADTFRRERALYSPESFAAWLRVQRFADDEIDGFFAREALERGAELPDVGSLAVHVVDYLRGTGEFAQVSARAIARKARPTFSPVSQADLNHAGFGEREVWAWYFAELGRVPPVDLANFARAECLATKDELYALVVQELAQQRALGAPP